MAITFSTTTHTGLVRGSNEDSFFARPPVFVVADGMGGAQAGEVASGMATDAFNHFSPQTKHPEDELARLISRINSSVYEAAGGDRRHSGMGTTITAAAIEGRSVGFAHVGDSRAYLWRKRKLSQITEDHSLVGELMRQGKLTSAEAADHPQRSIITRAVGVDKEVDIDKYTVERQPGDIFLLCSDGLYSMVSDEAIAGILARGEDLTVTANALVEAALSGGGSDNVTTVLFCPDGSVSAGDVAATEQFTLGESVGGDAEAVFGDADGPGDVQTKARRPRRTFRQWINSIPGRILAGLLIAVILLAAAWFGSRQFYYVGVEGGRVSIFKGVPYNFGPWPLYSLYRSSPAKIDDLEPFEQERVGKQNLQSLGDAEKMLQNYTDQANQRRDEAARKATEDAAKAKTQTTPVITPGALY